LMSEPRAIVLSFAEARRAYAQGNGGSTALLLRSARRECRHAQGQKS
jgi:hypothetical protein